MPSLISHPRGLFQKLKNFKTLSGSYLCLGLSVYVKNGIKISLDCPFNGLNMYVYVCRAVQYVQSVMVDGLGGGKARHMTVCHVFSLALGSD